MSLPLVVVAHPRWAESRIHAAWAQALQQGCARVHRLQPLGPEGRFDVPAEQALVAAHERIVFQFPLYWYSCPSLLSAWLEQVLLRGWAYGPGGRVLNGKTFGIALSTGSNADDYTAAGRYGRTIDEVTVPFELLALHTGMHYLPPFVLSGVREVDDAALMANAQAYCAHVTQAQPRRWWSGHDDQRARTVYPGQPGAWVAAGARHA